MDRFKPDELERRVDEVLYYKWDPIGINHYVSARAEYRPYVSSILQILKLGDSVKLIEKMQDIERNSMGLEGEESNAREISELLLSHKEAIENGHA
ncbi:hypothetical protein [Marinomonas colpomeniae]|uniref:Uncharacterized protein n=1 Tax=Marinomonas colpomeniae TaxID=2774408 RepID=A0ABR8P4F6_9GAMM|nr:hypothetical protein [Marinomonas colpomeniae]MBD5772217.1 hypothetical protein [Marinomonas colpomeniae]